MQRDGTVDTRTTAITLASMAILLTATVAYIKMQHNAEHRRTYACVDNQSYIYDAILRWSQDQGPKADGRAPRVSDLVPKYLKTMPQCPDGGSYTLRPVGYLVLCSIKAHQGFAY